jgi:hypothetical protein
VAATAYWRDIWRIINNADTSTCYDDGIVRVKHNDSFKALPMTKHSLINARIENEQKSRMFQYHKDMDSLEDVRQRSAKLVPLILNNYKTSQPLSRSVMDGIGNLPTMSGVKGQDPATLNYVVPNIYISPQEAAAIYSQKGLPETIINKKGKSPLLNGMKIKNPKLSPEQHDTIRDDMVKNSFANKIVEAIIQSLLYGGALVFPMFKRDTPLAMSVPVETLLKYDIVGKGCISHIVVLDRWNCVHIPNWNPCAKDFLIPREYYIPFLGSHVSGERCSRIVTGQQYGYWAVLMTLGWGISDIPGWIESVFNYYNVMSAIPTMIAQMSVVVRTMNVDGILATEGANILDDIDLANTVKVRESSVNNPIDLDVIGELKAIQRDFKEVPNLVRLIRQDVGGRANIPEELLWSSERGAFSSGDPTEGAQEKQWESIKYLHRDVAHQLKNIAMLEVINALGKGRDVLSALPYTTIEFDNPIVANAEVRSKILANTGKAILDIAGSTMPLDAVVRTISENSDDEFKVPADVTEELKSRQVEIDKRDKEQHEKEMALLDAQIALTNEQAENVGVAPVGSSGTGTGKGKILTSSSGGHGYSRLDQKRHEKTKGTAAERESLQRRRNQGSD